MKPLDGLFPVTSETLAHDPRMLWPGNLGATKLRVYSASFLTLPEASPPRASAPWRSRSRQGGIPSQFGVKAGRQGAYIGETGNTVEVLSYL